MEESGGVELGHGFMWSVLNASAWEELPDGQLRGLLRYIATEDAGRFEDARRAATDADYREELLRELGQK